MTRTSHDDPIRDPTCDPTCNSARDPYPDRAPRPGPGKAATPPIADRRTSGRRAGDAAEAAAARFLESRGLVPLARQYVRRIGELDLVAVDPATGTIVFAEVRYRGSTARGGAVASVDARKRARLRRTARAWLQRHADPRRPARIDVIGMAPGAPGPGTGGSGTDGAGPDDAGERGAGAVVDWEGYRLTWLPGAVDGG